MTILEQTQARLDKYIAAEDAILTNQEYSIAGRSLKRADLKAVKDMITTLENKVTRLTNNGNLSRKSQRVLPRDL